eukprot:3949970-Pyramimonas_sp.AAC.1
MVAVRHECERSSTFRVWAKMLLTTPVNEANHIATSYNSFNGCAVSALLQEAGAERDHSEVAN